MSRKRLAGLVACILLSGCQQPPSVDPTTGWKADWKTLDDGSSFARFNSADGDNQSAWRCWPSEGAFLCVTAGEMLAAGFNTHAIARRVEQKLPTSALPFVTSGDGYSCGYTIKPGERISRAGEALVSNYLDYATARWTRKYVSKYMDDNAINGSPYFDCLNILQAVRSGSLETLSTTTVTREMVE